MKKHTHLRIGTNGIAIIARCGYIGEKENFAVAYTCKHCKRMEKVMKFMEKKNFAKFIYGRNS